MKILVLHAHTANRGDEAAVKAMVDEILEAKPNANITICINGNTFYPNMPKQVKQIERMPKLHSKMALLEFYLFYLTGTKFAISKECKEFRTELLKADLVLHAPGGPSIGDIYSKVEKLYLYRLNLARKLKIPYMFYAPSMGPFNSGKNDDLRKKVISGADKVVVRDPISKQYLNQYLPNVQVEQHLDSALQHDVEFQKYDDIYNSYTALKEFIRIHPKCLGITVTDLAWHPTHGKTKLQTLIPEIFQKFVDEKIAEGYGIVYIPQLYGANDDTTLMNQFMRQKHTFMVEANKPEYDAYFQQYVIGKLYAVVGMRYHSNIFSAKMGTPFVSISYEQKMKGFMEKIGLDEYCIPIDELTLECLEGTFNRMCNNYPAYKEKLKEKHLQMKKDSHRTTEDALAILEKKTC